MDAAELRRLKYRRQYLITPQSYSCDFDHNSFVLNDLYTLYAHVDLVVTRYEQDNSKLILLGDIFNFEVPGKNNTDILKDLAGLAYGAVLEKVARYTGRYVLVFLDKDQFNVFTDLTASRKVYYSYTNKGPWLASQAHLLARVLDLKMTRDDSKLKYYNSGDFKRRDHANIGNTTCYDEIHQLIPNHYLNVNHREVHRFWPDKKIEIRSFEEVAQECAAMVKGYMEAISSRYKVMLPVTSGFDSRLLLSGIKRNKEEVYYYMNKNAGMPEDHPDIRIPRKLFRMLGLDFHVLDLGSDVDEKFKEVFYSNNPLATDRYLAHIYNYYKNHGDQINLPGNLAAHPIGINQLAEKNVSPDNLVSLYKFGDYPYAVAYITRWLEENQQLCTDCNIGVLRLFYLEERAANWMTSVQLDKDMAQEEINPLNSRLLLTKFFSVKRKYNSHPDKLLNRKIIEILWPELLRVPLNPGISQAMLRLLARLNLLGIIFKLKYKTAR